MLYDSALDVFGLCARKHLHGDIFAKFDQKFSHSSPSSSKSRKTIVIKPCTVDKMSFVYMDTLYQLHEQSVLSYESSQMRHVSVEHEQLFRLHQKCRVLSFSNILSKRYNRELQDNIVQSDLPKRWIIWRVFIDSHSLDPIALEFQHLNRLQTLERRHNDR